MRNIRISINDLIKAACVLGSFRVVDAGALYATLCVSAKQRRWLALKDINFTFDGE